jgi:hypothetical protein
MGFVLDQSDSYTWPVSLEIPIDGGKYERSTFKGKFKRITQSRAREMATSVGDGDTTEVDVCREVLIGWEGITDDQGEPEAFSQSKLNQLLEIPLVANAIGEAFFESMFGRLTGGAKRKN